MTDFFSAQSIDTITTLHLLYATEGPADGTGAHTLRMVSHAGEASFWNARQVGVGDTIRIHWAGNDAEPAAACSWVIASIEEVLLPIVTANACRMERTRRFRFDPLSAHDLVAGICPSRPRFNQSGMAYTHG